MGPAASRSLAAASVVSGPTGAVERSSATLDEQSRGMAPVDGLRPALARVLHFVDLGIHDVER